MNMSRLKQVFSRSDSRTESRNNPMEKRKNEDDFLQLINAIKNKNKKQFDELIEKTENSSLLFVFLKMFSNIPIERIDYEKARKEGRKKGDGKGKWPSRKIYDDEYCLNLIEINEIVNKNMWNVDNDINFCLLFHVLKNRTFLKDRSPAIIKKKVKKEKNNNMIDDFIEEELGITNTCEKNVIKKIIREQNYEKQIERIQSQKNKM